jgi:SAM-dependent methyltransferase
MKKNLIKIFGLHSNSDNRDNWVINELRSLKPGSKIIDIGAGEQKYKIYCENLAYISQDFCQYDGKGHHGLQTGDWNTADINIVSDILNIPVENNSFDCVLCTEVLEHVPDPELVIAEINRICKPGGTILLTAPFAAKYHFAPYFYSTGFSKYWYQFHLSKNGFSIIYIQSNGSFSSILISDLFVFAKLCNSRFFRYMLYLTSVITSTLILLSQNKDSFDELSTYGYFVKAKKIIDNKNDA